MHFLPMIVGFAASQVMTYLGLRRWFRTARARRLLLALIIAANLPWPYVIILLRNGQTAGRIVTAVVLRPFLAWQFGCLIGMLVFLLVMLGRLPFRALARYRRKAGHSETPLEPVAVSSTPVRTTGQGRRLFLQGALTAGAGVGFYGLGRTLAEPSITRLSLPLPSLPPALRGLRILHLSDIHLGFWVSAEEVGRVLEIARSLKADLGVITGDIADMNPSYAGTLGGMLQGVTPPLGWHVTLGNHDVYAGKDAITQLLRRAGVAVLRNEHVDLAPRGLPLLLVGTDDPGGDWAGAGAPIALERSLAGAPEDRTRILLAHRPTAFDQALGKNIALTLAGHTHGGQMSLPFGLPGIAHLTYKRPRGHYVEGAQHLYVSRGIGSVGLPFRLNSPPEIALLELTAG